jgi:hypothetical protein
MRRALLIVSLLCGACGDDPTTNDALAGKWLPANGVAGIHLSMTLRPSPDGVFGTATLQGDSGPPSTVSVSTLPGGKLRLGPETPFSDYRVRILPTCPGEPHPTPDRVYKIELTGSGGFTVVRDAPKPFCRPGTIDGIK